MWKKCEKNVKKMSKKYNIKKISNKLYSNIYDCYQDSSWTGLESNKL